MSSRLIELFEDQILQERIRNKLPYLFQIAQLESSRAARTGMEVGSARERVLIALLIYKFREENVDTQIPITSPEIDVGLFGEPVSIKTITGKGGVKVNWTVDAQKALEFSRNYSPICDILLAQIKWEHTKDFREGEHPGGLFLIPREVQAEVLGNLGVENYLSLPKPGTNPRGIEISRQAMPYLLKHDGTSCIEIIWRRSQTRYDPYKRWVDYWKE